MDTPPVPRALVGLVESWHGYDLSLPPGSGHHGLPSPTATVILSFDEPLDCSLGPSGERGQFWTLASGLHTGPAVIRAGSTMAGIQLNLTPAGVVRLLGEPLSALTNQLVGHPDLNLGISPALHDQLQEARWPARFRLLTEHLIALAGRTDAGRSGLAWARPEVAEAWRLLTGPGQLPVAEVARRVGWSPRQLQTQFRRACGVSPKQAAAIARFDRSRSLVRRGFSLVDAALTCGYTDQSHLNREWRRWAGETPSETAQGFRNIQDPEAGVAEQSVP